MHYEPLDMRRLWQSVIVQAMRDALRSGRARLETDDLQKFAARDWLEGRSTDFHHVCALAGIEPEVVWDWWQDVKDSADHYPTLTQLLNETRRKR
jgi:hypothetical protein